MFSFFHPASSKISVNVSTTTVTTTTEAVRLPLSPTFSSNSEGTIRTALTGETETEDERVEKVDTPDPKEDGARAAYPYFPTHPFRNSRHARRITFPNPPSPTQILSLHSDPCPFPSPPSPPLSRRGPSPNRHGNSNMYAVKLSTRFKFAKLLHFIPAGSKNRSRKEGEAGGCHYQRKRDRLLQERVDKGEKSPSTLWRSEGYM